MIIDYIQKINSRFQLGISTEHTFRGDLQNLIEGICSNVIVTNEPKRVACGAPDFVLTSSKIPVGHIEAKDIGDNDLLGKKKNKEQFERYKQSLPNLIITDYLTFYRYYEGELVDQVSIGIVEDNKIIPQQSNYLHFKNIVNDFVAFSGQNIKSAKRLSWIMAGKARLLAEVIHNALKYDTENDIDSSLSQQFNAFKLNLLSNIDIKEFSDLYSQTIAYGMFAARYNDPTPKDFSRQEAAILIPNTNPFLRKFFQYISGYDIDERIDWLVESLAEVFQSVNLKSVLSEIGTFRDGNDPLIHFYESFLGDYDKSLKKQRGVWYTPKPVVDFIVKSVDHVLENDLNLENGLANNERTKIKIQTQNIDKRFTDRYKVENRSVHKLQILDPAVGTGTFLAEIVHFVNNKYFKNSQGLWPKYAKEEFIPRLNGFELLMASYAIAHLKLGIVFEELGILKGTLKNRFKIFLCNALDQDETTSINLFASFLSDEAKEANFVKNLMPVMCIIGNPPYAIQSGNMSKIHRKLINKYKYVNGEKIKEKGALQFEKILNDDYVKFIAYSEDVINQVSSGVVGFVNNHNFIDSPQLRGMRFSLLNTFDKIYIVDLHGSSKKKETCKDGSKDDNVFDIQTGVSINIFVKTGKQPGEKAEVYYGEVYGKRKFKYDYLNGNTLDTINFTKVDTKSDSYYFFPRNYELEEEFYSYPSIEDYFKTNSTGVISARDNLSIDKDRDVLEKRINSFIESSDLSNDDLCKKFSISNKKGWDVTKARKNLKGVNVQSEIREYSYRPFDKRSIFFNDDLVWTTSKPIMKHFDANDNLALIIGRKGQAVGSMNWNLGFVSDSIIDFNFYYRGGVNVFPLFLKIEGSRGLSDKSERINIKDEIINLISNRIGKSFLTESTDEESFNPVSLNDYIYSIIYSDSYRNDFHDFLRLEFPRIPIPTDWNHFRENSKLGRMLRNLHLLKKVDTSLYDVSFPNDGDFIIKNTMTDKSNSFVITKDKKIGRVYINDEQFFEGVPEYAWNYYIGGYQPAKKWLKDRKGEHMSFNDIKKYIKIIVSIIETVRISKIIKYK